MTGSVAVVGSGVFGVTAALTLARRGYDVSLFDPGPIPHPLAASTDISKVVRLDYGADELYTALMERALAGWRAWNLGWPEPLFHETGVAFLSRAGLEPGGFEYESFALLTRRGHALERLDAEEIGRRFPAWNAAAYVDGYWNPQGGFAESGKVIAQLLRDARDGGVVLRNGVSFARLLEQNGRVVGIACADGERILADFVIMAAGAWTPHALPWMSAHLHSVAQPVFHLRPADATPFRREVFPVFGADIARTGYYGFPATEGGLVKIANHGAGRAMHPESPARAVTREDEERLRAFLRVAFPKLADAPIAATRACLYCDTHDEHFWIAPDPDRARLIVATGGSGHAFKFAPVLGDLIADALEGKDEPLLRRFRWRPEVRVARGEEAARHHE